MSNQLDLSSGPYGEDFVKRQREPKVPVRHGRAITANDVSECFTQTFSVLEDALRSEYQWVLPVLDKVAKGQRASAARPAGLSVHQIVDIVTLAEQVGVWKMWASRGRVTYDFNEHFAAELYRSSSDKIPGSIFRHLPHINPLVVLPDPWPISGGLVRGFYVYGVRKVENGLLQKVFTDDNWDYLGLLFVVDLLDDETGEVLSQTHVEAMLPTSRDRFTLKDAVQFSTVEEVDPRVQGKVSEICTELLRPAMSMLLYLCCDNRDMAEPPVAQPSVHRRAKVKRDRAPFFVEVGWRLGPKLHALRRQAGRVQDGESIPSGVEQAPHQRSGHFKRVLFGPKRSQETTKFIAPYWVRLDLLPDGEDPITTVVAVEEQRHDPLRRRGLKTIVRRTSARGPQP